MSTWALPEARRLGGAWGLLDLVSARIRRVGTHDSVSARRRTRRNRGDPAALRSCRARARGFGGAPRRSGGRRCLLLRSKARWMRPPRRSGSSTTCETIVNGRSRARVAALAAVAVVIAACQSSSSPAPASDPDTALLGGTGRSSTTVTRRSRTRRAISPWITADRFQIGDGIFNCNWAPAPAARSAGSRRPRPHVQREILLRRSTMLTDAVRPRGRDVSAFLGLLLRIECSGRRFVRRACARSSVRRPAAALRIFGVPGEGTPHVTYAEVPGASAPTVIPTRFEHHVHGDGLELRTARGRHGPRTAPRPADDRPRAPPSGRRVDDPRARAAERRKAELRLGRARADDGARALRMEGEPTPRSSSRCSPPQRTTRITSTLFTAGLPVRAERVRHGSRLPLESRAPSALRKRTRGPRDGHGRSGAPAPR